MLNFKLYRTVLFFFILFTVKSVQANHLWELGAGLGQVSTTAYVGSSESVSLQSPIPYIKWQTDWFDLSDGDLHLNIWQDTPFRLSFNFDLALPVKSSETPLRQDMPDLDPVVQVGPLIAYQIDADSDVKWQFDFPLMFAFALSDKPQAIGWNFIPRLRGMYQYKIDSHDNYDLEWSLGPVYASRDYNSYYYRVGNSESTINRPSYDANGGFSGYRFNISLSKRIRHAWMGFYIRYQNLSEAVFRDSPLVDNSDYWVVGFGASWIFAGEH